jgi:hypothetical protein
MTINTNSHRVDVRTSVDNFVLLAAEIKEIQQLYPPTNEAN